MRERAESEQDKAGRGKKRETGGSRRGSGRYRDREITGESRRRNGRD